MMKMTMNSTVYSICSIQFANLLSDLFLYFLSVYYYFLWSIGMWEDRYNIDPGNNQMTDQTIRRFEGKKKVNEHDSECKRPD